MNLTNKWKQSGRISLWRYVENERNYRGWHLNADAAGCKSLLMLLEILVTQGSGYRTIALTAPTATQLRVPNNRSGRAAWVSPTKLRFGISESPAEWELTSALDPAILLIGLDWAVPLRDGVAGIPRGHGDYSIGSRNSGSLRLWFWW